MTIVHIIHNTVCGGGEGKSSVPRWCSFSIMVKWANDGLLQANDGKILVNDGEMLVNDGEMLVNGGEMSICSYIHFTIIN